jgi:hypothetical protein
MTCFSACTAATQSKVKSALDEIHCVADTLDPYAQYFLSTQFMDALQGKDYVEILVGAGISPKEIEKVVADVKACHQPQAE